MNMKSEVALIPPGREVGFANCHWVHPSGNGSGLEVWQWQPSAKKWCRPNQFACDMNHDLIGYKYVAICPLPVTEEELVEFRATHDQIRESAFFQALPEAQREQFNLLIAEQMYVYPKVRKRA